ncbi:hypothetical protein CRG98_012446 [Punica granatum]|uniref:Neprosin activation peptide domain-containing protein n=1 Tax=Punica granatum TaxID=22663 RepID=A0A2I0KFD1_PUNGR|nr:hypothetical protein CRG98_012446 [Punica granatum]
MVKWEVFLSIIVLMTCTSLANGLEKKSISIETYKEINEKLKLLNRPAVNTITSEDGDIIDCVDIHKQPAFDHPTPKNHVAHMRPTYKLSEDTARPTNVSSKPVVSQMWRRSGSCPEGTIPIRRIRRRDLVRASSVRRFGMKNPHFSPPPSNATTVNRPVNRTIGFNNTRYELGYLPNRSVSPCLRPILFSNYNSFIPQTLLPILTYRCTYVRVEMRQNTNFGCTQSSMTLGLNYIGASADVNIWSPSIDPDLHSDYSSDPIWLLGGPAMISIASNLDGS